jgi:hypothetical protein
VFWSYKRRRKKKEEQTSLANQGWNDCIDAVKDLIEKHRWMVDEDDPTEIFCDSCGEVLLNALQGLRR